MSITDRLFKTEECLAQMVETAGGTVPTPGERTDIVSHLDYIIALLGVMVTEETLDTATEKMAKGYNAIGDRIDIINDLLASGDISIG